MTIPLRRDHPGAKDTRFIATASEAYGTLPPGAHEGLMVAEDGSILEGLSSNFFAVLDGVLQTEGERALHGITRSIMLELAQGLVPVSLTPVRVADLPRVDGVLPHQRVAGDPARDARGRRRDRPGAPGPVTRR